MQTICLDFDGVIHSYEKGWQGGKLYGTVTPGFFDWALEAEKLFRLVIYSTRSGTPGARMEMRRWIKAQWERDGRSGPIPSFEYASKKPPAWLTIDDRAVTFKGDWNEFSPTAILAFRPWHEERRKVPAGAA